MITYTALSPDNTRVVVSVRSLARALELAAEDLARDWVRAQIRVGERRFDIDAILMLLVARWVSAA
jgi:hypothetical protein